MGAFFKEKNLGNVLQEFVILNLHIANVFAFFQECSERKGDKERR